MLFRSKSAYTSTQIQNNIVQQKYNILRTHQMLSINIERIGANNKLILTMTTIIIHRERGGEREREREREGAITNLRL